MTGISVRQGLMESFGTLLAMIGLNYAMNFLAWGSMPVIRESSGDLYLRTIPFIPWPNYPFHL